MSLRAHRRPPRRFRGACSVRIAGAIVPVAGSRLGRLLGLALLDRRRAGAGLLIPRCRAVHTFGMRFPLEVVFLDADFRAISHRPGLRPRRFAYERAAAAVLELPAEGVTDDAA
jgi:uncharacterized membrane protein (UPF0127 family)